MLRSDRTIIETLELVRIRLTLSRAALKDSFESQQSDVFRMELVEMDPKPSNVTADMLEKIRTKQARTGNNDWLA